MNWSWSIGGLNIFPMQFLELIPIFAHVLLALHVSNLYIYFFATHKEFQKLEDGSAKYNLKISFRGLDAIREILFKMYLSVFLLLFSLYLSQSSEIMKLVKLLLISDFVLLSSCKKILLDLYWLVVYCVKKNILIAARYIWFNLIHYSRRFNLVIFIMIFFTT